MQRLLRFLGMISLSDGTVVNGFNACRILGRDLYFGLDDKFGFDPATDWVRVMEALVCPDYVSDAAEFLAPGARPPVTGFKM